MFAGLIPFLIWIWREGFLNVPACIYLVRIFAAPPNNILICHRKRSHLLSEKTLLSTCSGFLSSDGKFIIILICVEIYKLFVQITFIGSFKTSNWTINPANSQVQIWTTICQKVFVFNLPAGAAWVTVVAAAVSQTIGGSRLFSTALRSAPLSALIACHPPTHHKLLLAKNLKFGHRD